MSRPLCAALLVLAGCASEGERIVIGYFQIKATRTEACSETGLPAAPEQTTLHAHLQRFGTMLQWDDGTGLKVGEYLPDKRSFEVPFSIFVDMREGRKDLPPCRIERRMLIAGQLDEKLETFE